MCGDYSLAPEALVAEMQSRAEANNHSAAFQYFNNLDPHEQRNHTRSPYMFNLMIRGCAASEDYSGADFWLQAMLRLGVTPNVHTFVPILNMLAESGDMATLDAHMSMMKDLGVEHNMFTYSSYIKACSSKGDVARAETVLEEMKQKGVGISHVSYNSLIHTCARAGQIDKAEMYLLEMMEAGIEPTLITYNTVINACATDGNTQRAEFWLQYMSQRGMTANDVTFGTICKAFAYRGDVAKVESIMEHYKTTGKKLNEYFYASLLTACEKANPLNKERAERVYAEMARANLCVLRVIKPLTRLLGPRRVDQLRRQVEKESAASEPRCAEKVGRRRFKDANAQQQSSSSREFLPGNDQPFAVEEHALGVDSLFEDAETHDEVSSSRSTSKRISSKTSSAGISGGSPDPTHSTDHFPDSRVWHQQNPSSSCAWPQQQPSSSSVGSYRFPWSKGFGRGHMAYSDVHARTSGPTHEVGSRAAHPVPEAEYEPVGTSTSSVMNELPRIQDALLSGAVVSL